MGTTSGNRVMAFARVVGTVGSDRTDVLLVGDLVKQLWQHGRVTDIAGRDLDGPDLQRLLVDPNMYLAPDAAFGASVLAGVPLTFALMRSEFPVSADSVESQLFAARARLGA